MVDTIGTTVLGYDASYQLTSVTYPNADTQSYTYDAMGNRLTKVHNGTPTSYTYDDADQMLTAGGVTYTYEANGNQTGRGSEAPRARRSRAVRDRGRPRVISCSRGVAGR